MTGCFGKFDLQNICESIYDKTRPPMFTDIEELEYQGKDYMLTARVYEAVKSDIEYTRDKTIQYIRAKEMIIEYIKKNGSANRATVQELCGFSEQQARRTLEKMQKEYIIKLANGGRYAKYTLI